MKIWREGDAVGITCVKIHDDVALEAWTQRGERETYVHICIFMEGESQREVCIQEVVSYFQKLDILDTISCCIL